MREAAVRVDLAALEGISSVDRRDLLPLLSNHRPLYLYTFSAAHSTTRPTIVSLSSLS